MNYTLLDMCDVGAELGRLPAGAEAAEVLLTALSLDHRGLDRVADAHPGFERRPFEPDSDHLLDRLVRLVRDEFLDWTWQATDGVRWQSLRARAAADVFADALTAVCADGSVPPHVVAQLQAPWDYAARSVRSADLGPNYRLVRQVLIGLAEIDPAQRQALLNFVDTDVAVSARAAAAGPGVRSAVELTGRSRPAAAAQLLLVRSFVRSGLARFDRAGEVWAAVSRLVQGLVVNDLLADETAEVLQAFWRTALGHPVV